MVCVSYSLIMIIYLLFIGVHASRLKGRNEPTYFPGRELFTLPLPTPLGRKVWGSSGVHDLLFLSNRVQHQSALTGLDKWFYLFGC